MRSHDDGSSASDGVTTDPALAGHVSRVLGDDLVVIEFDHNNDGTSDGTARLDWRGEFTYFPEELAAGSVTVRSRAGRWDTDREAYVYGDWSPLAFTLQADSTNTPPAVTSFGLVFDTGSSATDAITSDPTVRGTVTDNGRTEAVLVQLDTNNDGVADATMRTDAAGQFTYKPAGIATEAYTIAARAREWDPGQNAYSFGDWTTLSFTLDYTADEPPTMQSLTLFRDSGTSSSDGVTSDATLGGEVADDGKRAGLRIEFDLNGDDVVDGFTFTAENGAFWYIPSGLIAGAYTVRARAGQCRGDHQPCLWPDDPESGYVTSDWTSLTFTLEFPANNPAQVSGLALVRDTGSSASDGLTAVAALTGAVTNDGDFGSLRVEFDHNGDGVVDGVVFTATDGAFSYEPSGLSDGPTTISARVREWDDATGSYIFGDWTSLNFTLDPSANLAPALASLALLHDTGVSASDGVTRDPRVKGSVTDDGDVSSLLIEFDHDGDGDGDGSTRTDVQGKFLYAPAGLADGPVTIHARAVETPSPLWGESGGEGSAGSVLIGDWVSITFTLDPTADAPPAVISLVLANDTGSSGTDNVTTDSAVKGQAANDDGVLHMIVEFDHNGDGDVDGQTITDHEGKFTYKPAGLQPGAISLRARAKVKEFGQGDFVTGEWSTLTFTLEQGGPPSTPQGEHGASAEAAFELAVATTIETYNSVTGGGTSQSAFKLQHGSFAPQGNPAEGTTSGGVSPISSTPLSISTASAIPTSSSTHTTAIATKTATTEHGAYTSTSEVTIEGDTTVAGDSVSGTFSETVNVCDSFNHVETGSIADGTTITTYSFSESGSFCFTYTGSGTYTVATDGLITISGTYALGVNAGYGYSFAATSNTNVVEPGLLFTESATVTDSGNASLTYSEGGTYSASVTTSSFSGVAALSLTGSGGGSLTALGSYAVSTPSTGPTSPASMGTGSVSGAYAMTAGDSYQFTTSANLNLNVNGSAILVGGSASAGGNVTAGFGYIDVGSYAYSGSGGSGSGSYLMQMGASSAGGSSASVGFTLTNTSAVASGSFAGGSSDSASFDYNESGSFSYSSGTGVPAGGSTGGAGSSSSGSGSTTGGTAPAAPATGYSGGGSYLLLSNASFGGSASVDANFTATQSSFSVIGIFTGGASGNASAQYVESGGYSFPGTSAIYFTSSGGVAQFSAVVGGNFTITDTGFVIIGTAVTGSSSLAGSISVEHGTHTAPGGSSTFHRLDASNSQSASGSQVSFSVSDSGYAIGGDFGSSQSASTQSLYTENGNSGGTQVVTISTDNSSGTGSISGSFLAGPNSIGLVADFSSSSSFSSAYFYQETGNTVSGNQYKITRETDLASSESDLGTLNVANSSFAVDGDFTQSSYSHQNDYYKTGDLGDPAATPPTTPAYPYIYDEGSSTSTRTTSGTYHVSDMSSHSNGDYQATMVDWHSGHSVMKGNYPIDSGTMNYAEESSANSWSSFTDQGTFQTSASVSAPPSHSTTGKVEQSDTSNMWYERKEQGTWSGGNSKSNDTWWSDSGSETTSHYTDIPYLRTAYGPYSSWEYSGSSHDSTETGEAGSGGCYQAKSNGKTSSSATDDGNFSELNDYWSRIGKYSYKSSASSEVSHEETGTLDGASITAGPCSALFPLSSSGGGGSGSASGSGGPLTGTYTLVRKDESSHQDSDEATYHRHSNGYTDKGDYSTLITSFSSSVYKRQGSFSDGTTSFDLNSNDTVTVNVTDSDSGKHEVNVGTFERKGTHGVVSSSVESHTLDKTNGQIASGTGGITFEHHSSVSDTWVSDVETKYKVTQDGTAWTTDYDISRTAANTSSNTAKGNFSDGTTSGTSTSSTSAWGSSGFRDIGTTASAGVTGSGTYYQWVNGGAQSNATEKSTTGTVTTTTTTVTDQSYQYDDNKTYTNLDGHSTGSGTIYESIYGKLDWNRSNTGTFNCGGMVEGGGDEPLNETMVFAQYVNTFSTTPYTFTDEQIDKGTTATTNNGAQDFWDHQHPPSCQSKLLVAPAEVPRLTGNTNEPPSPNSSGSAGGSVGGQAAGLGEGGAHRKTKYGGGDWLDRLTSFFMGWGHEVSNGITTKIIGTYVNDAQMAANQARGEYGAGQIVGFVNNIGLAFGNPCNMSTLVGMGFRGLQVLNFIGAAGDFQSGYNAGDGWGMFWSGLGIAGSAGDIFGACFVAKTQVVLDDDEEFVETQIAVAGMLDTDATDLDDADSLAAIRDGETGSPTGEASESEPRSYSLLRGVFGTTVAFTLGGLAVRQLWVRKRRRKEAAELFDVAMAESDPMLARVPAFDACEDLDELVGSTVSAASRARPLAFALFPTAGESDG